MPSRDTAQGAFIKSSFGTIWPVHLAGFTRMLVQLRKRFDGDLDLVLVLAVIGSRTLPERWVPALDELTQMTRLNDTETRQLPINIQSVAEYSGIPRETVRRKVVTLQEKGWVARGADGCLTVTRGAACDLEAATGDTIAYLASLLLAFEAAKAAGADEE